MRCLIHHIENELFRYGYKDYSRVFVCDSNIEIGQVKCQRLIYEYIRTYDIASIFCLFYDKWLIALERVIIDDWLSFKHSRLLFTFISRPERSFSVIRMHLSSSKQQFDNLPNPTAFPLVFTTKISKPANE